jgi:hypothetical protein
MSMDKARSLEQLYIVADRQLGMSPTLLIRILEKDGFLRKGVPTVLAFKDGMSAGNQV